MTDDEMEMTLRAVEERCAELESRVSILEDYDFGEDGYDEEDLTDEEEASLEECEEECEEAFGMGVEGDLP